MDPDAIKRSLAGSDPRSTPQRYVVMAFLMKQARHLTAAEIFEAVKRVDPRSPSATIYDNFRDSAQAGLVREVAMEGRAARLMPKARRSLARQAGPSRMRTHFPGAVRQVRAPARFPLTSLVRRKG
jgi:Fe2+ or Zn2+ uptake regulation protein